MNRSEQLLTAAADALKSGSDPFTETFLGEHRVRLDEALDLGQHIATILEAYLKAPNELRAQLMVALVVDDPKVAEYMQERLSVEALKSWRYKVPPKEV